MADSADVHHYLDIALQQSVMVAFTVPVIGPGLAAGFSILDSILHESKVNELSTANYSVELAFGQLYKSIKQLLISQNMQHTDAVISGYQTGADSDQHTIDYATNDVHFWDDNMKLASLEGSVTDFHTSIGTQPITEIFKWMEGQSGEELVKSLDLYLIARSNFQNQCHTKLQIQAIVLQQQAKLKGNIIALPKYYDTHNEIVDDMLDNASAAITFAEKKIEHLQYVFATRVSTAMKQAKAKHPIPGLKQQQMFTQELRLINESEYLAFTSEERLQKMQLLVAGFQRVYVGLKPKSIDSVKAKQRDAITNTKPRAYNPLGT